EGQNARRNAINFTIALESLKATFASLVSGIGLDVQPAITRFMTALNDKILRVDESGRSVGSSLRELAAQFANSAWRALTEIMDSISIETINDWIETISTGWDPVQTADKIEGIFRAVWTFGSAIASLISALNAFWNALPDFIKSRGVAAGAAAGAV